MMGSPLLLSLASLLLLIALPAQADPQPDVSAVEAEPRDKAADRLGLRVDDGAPIDITADELEAVQDADGAERVIFRSNVRVVQGTLQIRADRIEAVYPRGTDGRPARIEASRNVRITQGGAQAECSEAVFEETLNRITCSDDKGAAVLRRGADVVRGERIEFDLSKGVLKVRGRARVRIEPRKREATTAEPESPGTPTETGG